MKVGARNNKTMVMEIFTGAPAYKAGIRPGDILVAVSDKPTDGLTTSDVADLLKGPRGTTVKVSVVRQGHSEPLVFEVTRDAISRKSVPDAYFVRPGIAYLQIIQFNETTSREMDENLKRLGEQNMKGLVLDLRGNPGGLAERRRGGRGPFSAEGPGDRFSPRPIFRREAVHGARRQ